MEFISVQQVRIVKVVPSKIGQIKSALSRATKTKSSFGGYCKTSGNIAAIDFGTTSVSLAYSTSDDELSTLKLDKVKQLHRVPNAILINEEDAKIINIGHRAREEYLSNVKRTSLKRKYIYFDKIKMLMKRDEKVTRETVIQSFYGESYYLVEVTAYIIKYLRDLLLDYLSRLSVRRLETTDFNWVITVPAIWDARGKGMMREAAYLAGLLNGQGISKFTPVTDEGIPRPIEDNPDKLSLALEPEVAAIYSQKHVSEDIAKAGDAAAIVMPKCYMVIDIGGGTVDITVHREDGVRGIDVVSLPTGNDWGGNRINEKFSKMLQKIVGDEGFRCFLTHGDEIDRVKNQATLDGILYAEFEEEKIIFGSKCDEKSIADGDECIVTLRAEFIDFYTEEKVIAGCSKVPGVQYEDNNLYMQYRTVERELFSEVVNHINDCSLKAFIEVGKVDTVYLVGGFGSCKYVKKKIEEAIEEKIPGINVNVVVPQDPRLAIVCGAVLWRKNPEIIKARTADATYGIMVSIPFDSEKHDPYYKYFNEEQQRYFTGSIFKVFLEKGEAILADEVIVSSIVPATSDMTEMTFSIYSTPRTDVQYVKDKNRRCVVDEIGRITIEIPDMGRKREERIAEVTMDFSGTEIQVKGEYKVTGEEVKTVCDFLSSH